MKKFLSLLFLVLFLFSFACESDSATDTEEPQANAQEATPSEPAADDTADPENASVDDVSFDYPGLPVDSLSATQRAQLQELAEDELCPCPDAVVSLHECMQTEDRCDEANTMATSFLSAVQQGAAADEARGQIAEERTATGRVHEFLLEDVPVKGSLDADVIIVEFADFQCPHCRTASAVLAQVAEQFGDDIGIVFKNFPLGSPMSDIAARATVAAHQQNRFWQMHDLIFQNQTQVNPQRIDGFANQIGLNFEKFKADMNSADVRAGVARDRQEGLNAGVNGTPAIYINGQRYMGPLTPDAIGTEIRARL